jgi:hypothetical protein
MISSFPLIQAEGKTKKEVHRSPCLLCVFSFRSQFQSKEKEEEGRKRKHKKLKKKTKAQNEKQEKFN